MKVTQSLLSTFTDCGLKAQYNIDQPAWHKTVGGSRRAVGTAYHAGLEHLYVRRQEGLETGLVSMAARALDAFDTECVTDSYTGQPVDEFIWDDMVPDRDKAVEVITAMLAEYENHIWPIDWEVIDVETRHIVEMDGFTNSFALDLVLRDPNGWIVGIDNKTAGKTWPQGKEHPRKNTQAALYVAGLQQVFPGAPGYRFVFDVMSYPTAKNGPKFERRISDPKAEHIEAVIKRAQDFAFIYQTVHIKAGMDLQANPASTLCNAKWCDHFQGCPYGAALEN